MLTQVRLSQQPFGSSTIWLGIALLAMVWLLSACASSVPLDKPPSTKTGADQSNSKAASTAPHVVQDTIVGGESAVKPVMAQSWDAQHQAIGKLPDVIYFDFDSFIIHEDAVPVVESYAKLLRSKPSQRLLLEGHTDEQGGREYNLALGQKRAESVMRALIVLGASGEQLEPVSMGEEQPAALGGGESVWSKNRRVQLRLN